ncbi:MAG: thioredoxin family protein [Lentisphaeria bacterium]|nr:thioredoxin family protein [Lentisphaeria bacterium]
MSSVFFVLNMNLKEIKQMKVFSFVCILCALSLFAAPPPPNGAQPPKKGPGEIQTPPRPEGPANVGQRPAAGGPKVEDAKKSGKRDSGKNINRYHDGKHFEGGEKKHDGHGKGGLRNPKDNGGKPMEKRDPVPQVKPVAQPTPPNKPEPVPQPIAPPLPKPVSPPIAPPPPQKHGVIIPPPRTVPLPYVEEIVIPRPIGSTTPLGWFDDWDSATLEARRHNRPILVLFSGSDWCKWCQKLHREVLDTKEFKEFAAHNLILVYMDTPVNRTLPKQLVQTRKRLQMMLQTGDEMPCTFILSPHEDKWKEIDGFDRDYLKIIKRVLHKHGY